MAEGHSKSTEMTPKVSIIIPMYNASKYIGECIQSVINQTHTNWELILIDDGSTDNTKSIIEPYLEDDRIRYFWQENGKQGKARNHGVRKTTGMFIGFLDADDKWHERKLDRQIEVFSKDKVDVVYSSGHSFKIKDSDTQLLSKFGIKEGVQTGKQLIFDLIQKNYIPLTSVLMTKERFEEVGGFNENLKIQNAEDLNLWLKLADLNCKFYGLDESLFYYRKHENQSTNDDPVSIQQAVHAIKEIDFKSINKEEKKHHLISFLMKQLRTQQENKTASFYINLKLLKAPLRAYYRYYQILLLNKISPKTLNRFAHRIFK